MKCIVLLTLVALCYSYPYGSGFGSGYGYGSGFGSSFGYGGKMNINPDGSVTLITGNGKKITISKNIDQTGVAIAVTSPYGVSNSQNQLWNNYQPSQDILGQILTQYQGEVSPFTYQQLLGEVNAAVQNGQLNNAVYQVLQGLVGPSQGGYFGSQVGLTGIPVQQLLQQQQYQQGIPLYAYGAQYPYSQIAGTIQGVTGPVGVNQQEQIIEGLLSQGPQVVPYPGMTGFTSGSQGVLGQQTFGGITGGIIGGTGKTQLNTLINYLLSGKGPQYPLQYGQQVGPIGPYFTGELSQIAQKEGQILGQQSQIQQGQVEQQQQQQQLLQQQWQQQQLQQQQQIQQQYVQQLQQQVQQEQQQVVEQQLQQQQQQYGILMNLLKGTTQGGVTGFSQQLPSIYTQGGLSGAYGQGIHQFNVPLVY